MNDTVKLHAQNVRMIAHRGLSGIERENTNAAFVAAENRSYYGIETDIHCTIDGHFVIYHDDNTFRLTDVDWNVEEHTLEELRSLMLKDLDDCKRTDLVLPTLDEYIRICKKYGKISVLELKNHFECADIQRIVEIIQNEGWINQTIFISFDLENLIVLRNLLPKQKIQYLVYQISPELPSVLKMYSLDVDVKYAGLEPEHVKLLHEAGCEINVWTVNSYDDGLRMAEMGVDFITTNILE